MRVLVVGSVRHWEAKKSNGARWEPIDDDAEREKREIALKTAAEEIGKALARRGHQVLVGSEDPGDVDPAVVKGATSEPSHKVVEVHLMQGALECYEDLQREKKVLNVRHRYGDWDVTVLEVLRKDADAVIALGGRVGVIQTGIAAWMLGKAVIPIAGFGGGARVVWGYGSGERQSFYFGAISDREIDSLLNGWGDGGADADSVVAHLESAHEHAQLSRNPTRWSPLAGLMAFAALGAWVFLLCAPFFELSVAGVQHEQARFVLLLLSVCCAGTLGALMQSLRRMRDGRGTSLALILIDGILGTAAGLITAALYLVAQVAVTGKVEMPATEDDYVRSALVTGLASLFASLYLDAALARLDGIREQVLAGKYGASS